MLALDIRGGIEHFLHSGSSFGAFEGDDHHIAALDPVAEYAVNCGFLRGKHFGGPAETEDAGVYAGCLDYAAVPGDVAFEHCEASVFT